MGAAQTVNTPCFDTVWALMQENAQQMKELRESQKETGRQIQELRESQKETGRIVQNNAQQIGNLGNRLGEWVEYMVMPNLVEKFQELGFVFTRAYHDAAIKDREHNIFVQVDITLENGDKVMVVEVKSKPTTEDITDHIERMEKVRAHANLHNDTRVYLGAIAGMVFNDNERTFAMKNGFFVIEPSGETFIITEPKGEYSPREWQGPELA
ncbi:MAG: hypothetical protein LBH07_02750 [Treponema sp.]|jgi:hypothetical protein|nr:hypothetical protein [Treponema sp.]